MHVDAVDVVVLELREVVRDVVQQAQFSLRSDPRERAAGHLGEQLAVGAAEVRRRGHRAEITLSLPRANRGARELQIRGRDAELAHGGLHRTDVVGADLVAEPTRAGVDHHAHTTASKPTPPGDTTPPSSTSVAATPPIGKP